MATLQSGKCFTVPTFFGMCCRSEWQERMYIYKWHEVDQTKHEIFCVHIVCNEIQVKVNLEITTFFFYLLFPYCPNFFWFGVVYCKENNILQKPSFSNSSNPCSIDKDGRGKLKMLSIQVHLKKLQYREKKWNFHTVYSRFITCKVKHFKSYFCFKFLWLALTAHESQKSSISKY